MSRYKQLLKINVAGKEKINFLLSLNRRRLDENHALIELPGSVNKGIICHKYGLVLNYSKNKEYSLWDRFVGEVDINDEHFYLYKVSSLNNTSKYKWCQLGWTNLYAAEHVFISIAFGLWDNIRDLDGMEVCHKVAVTKDKCDNSVSNLFVDSHRFNVVCAKLEQALRAAGVTGSIPLDRETFKHWTYVLNTYVEMEQWGRSQKG